MIVMRLELPDFASILRGTLSHHAERPATVHNISIHSGRIQQDAAFFALAGATTDGHRYVADALRNGAVVAVVNSQWHAQSGHGISGAMIVVEDTLAALQRLATWQRERIAGRVVGITGSNGKTMVKDALQQILSTTYRCAASPGSFNSQLGVPLAILHTLEDAEVALFEAGISAPGEMARLESMMRPDYGVLTNLGWAHVAAFGSREAIAAEKAQLYAHIPADGWVLAPNGDELVDKITRALACRVYRFGDPAADLPQIESRQTSGTETVLRARFPAGEEVSFAVHSTLAEIVTDIEIALCAGWLLGVSPTDIAAAMMHYTPRITRQEIWKSPNGVTLLNDSDNSDPLAVQAALRMLETMSAPGGRRYFLFGSGRDRAETDYAEIGLLAARHGVDELLLIGERALQSAEAAFRAERPERPAGVYATVATAKEHLLGRLKSGDTLLVKGYGPAGVDRIARDLVEAMAPNRFYLDLNAVTENVSRIRRLVGPQTRILAMLKALAYGTDAVQLARELQQMGIDQIGVSSADEGRQLREAGIDLPILVMMCTPEEVEKLTRYGLTPMIYSFEIAAAVTAAMRGLERVLDVHIEVDTGMGRLGVRPDQIEELVKAIEGCGCLRLCGLMTHFAGADDPQADEFTRQQLGRFLEVRSKLEAMGYTDLICHTAATAGAIRFPEARLDMVRVGIGLYGIYPSASVEQALDLTLAVALVSRIVKITEHRKGDRIGYGGTFVVPADGFRAAAAPMGYHDGFPWTLGNTGYVLINGRRAPICGRISMDSMVVDVTGIPDAAVGVDVLLYGWRGGCTIRPEETALLAGTIAYELLARLGPRVQRIFLGI